MLIHEVRDTKILEFDFIWLTLLSLMRKAGRLFIVLNPRDGGKLRLLGKDLYLGPRLASVCDIALTGFCYIKGRTGVLVAQSIKEDVPYFIALLAWLLSKVVKFKLLIAYPRGDWA